MSAPETPGTTKPRPPRKGRARARVVIYAAPVHFGLMLTQAEAATYMGLSLTRFAQVRDLDEHFPDPVALDGPPNALPQYRREDIDTYVRALRPVERARAARGSRKETAA
jgi:hypothetical protein